MVAFDVAPYLQPPLRDDVQRVLRSLSLALPRLKVGCT